MCGVYIYKNLIFIRKRQLVKVVILEIYYYFFKKATSKVVTVQVYPSLLEHCTVLTEFL